MTREQAARVLKYLWIERDENAKLMQQLTTRFFERQEALRMGAAALRGPGWVRTVDRPPEGDEHKEVLGLYKGSDYLLYDIVQIGWLRLHPKMYPYWTHLPEKPEVEDEH